MPLLSSDNVYVVVNFFPQVIFFVGYGNVC